MYIIVKITNVEEDCIDISTMQPMQAIIYIKCFYKFLLLLKIIHNWKWKEMLFLYQ